MAKKMEARNVYVIGAGFSAGLGYPLTSDLLVRLWERIDDPYYKVKLTKVIKFHHPNFDEDRFKSFPNVEQLLSEMLVNEELFDASRQYEGNFTRQKLIEVQRDLLLKIADWFHELSDKVKPSGPTVPWLKRFAERVDSEKATVISFNWDLILDEHLFVHEINGVSYGFEKRLAEGPVLLKPHGSLNWFEAPSARYLKDKKRVLIFKDIRLTSATACTCCADNDENDAIYAFREFRAPISKKGRSYSPLIIPPVYLKNFEKPVFTALWQNCTSALSSARKVIFLGYSMPAADLHAQFIMRCGFNNQIEGELGNDGKRKPPTGPSEVLIVNPDRAAAHRIEAVAGPSHTCRWVSTPVADWVLAS